MARPGENLILHWWILGPCGLMKELKSSLFPPPAVVPAPSRASAVSGPPGSILWLIQRRPRRKFPWPPFTPCTGPNLSVRPRDGVHHGSGLLSHLVFLSLTFSDTPLGTHRRLSFEEMLGDKNLEALLHHMQSVGRR